MSTRQTAETLHLAVKTIETYYAHIKQKLGLESMRELRVYAARWVQSEGTS
jgi:DNA-binding NarL/FixJ family response regulator